MCSVHGKLKEVISMDDDTAICTDCALFGNYKNRNFISTEKAIEN